MIKAIIVDDEARARKVLRSLLEEFLTGIKVVGEAHSVDSAEALIRKSDFDLLFLDVEMPGGNGFNLLGRFTRMEFQVIFTTAYSQYAVEALRNSALDYLLKPIELEQLKAALQRYEDRRTSRDDQQVILLPSDIGQAMRQAQKIILPIPKGFKVVTISDIIYGKASGNYTEFCLASGQKILVARTLKYFEEQLSDMGMQRIHGSHLVNLHHVDQYERGRGGIVIMSNGDKLEVARGRKEKLVRWFSAR